MIAQFHHHARRWTAVAACAMLALACLALTDAVRGDDAATAPANKPAKLEQQTIKMADGKIVTTNDFRDAIAPTSKPSAFRMDEERTYQEFQRRLPEINFQAIPFSDAIDFIRDVTGMNINVNWQVFEAAGIDRNVPITIRLRDVTLEQVLGQLLRQGGGGNMQLVFSLDGNIIVITTLEETRGRPRAYDVHDLINDSDSEVAKLEKLVMDNIPSGSWQQTGGTLGTINILSGRMIVNTADMYHLEIDRLLAELRRAK